MKTEETARHGTGAVKSYLDKSATTDSDGVRYAGMYQSAYLEPGTYTFSAYVNTTGMGSCDTNGGIYADYTIKRGCRTRSSPMPQPLARTRFREKILKVLLLTFLSRKVRLTSR